ncbi:SpaH/EbpB family LPXTG-anchored major pilin [Ruminococcus sp. CLA-AA-H200]|uniref:SpaH/EbpB family LPXTG-anchored major pilin n=2 Tax=Ruminococcus turbiniformis TaxID=2881258 RepID=A0ABS8G0T3_9FIRM|nr:SpaH/EbpB family LPXTG-anchored major pilin [Ruminococcus turbiniformis]
MVDTANPTAEINIKSDYPDDPDDGIEKVVQEDDTDEWGNSADFEIGQTIPYQVTTEIPDINGYETYYYAWHDQMSESLTFHADKSDISIVISDGSKNYILTSGEYNVLTSGAQLDEGDTFVIEVQDIKRIVDREFSKENNLGENDYTGITVTLQYEATLNDNAVDETGSQGIGNSVRLEYSNDPETDSTGYTPFDTTTSYTFVLNANKVNNHDRVLADAKFRLYADEDCTQEVYVKPADGVGGNSYIVINRDSLGGNDHTGGTTPGNAVEMVSDANGDFTIYGLDTGTYYLKETDAPAGYRQLLDPITITIDAEYNDEALQSMSANASIISFYDGAYSTDNVQLNTDLAAGSADIQIVNEVGTRLPITGSNAMLIMLGAGVVLVGGAAFVYKRHKKATED